MFILRMITPNDVEVNTELDIYYTLVLKEKNEDLFKEITSQWEQEHLDGLYGVVCIEDTDLIMPLYEEYSYYIMTSEGKTFANISKK